jgi:hypothetical protein
MAERRGGRVQELQQRLLAQTVGKPPVAPRRSAERVLPTMAVSVATAKIALREKTVTGTAAKASPLHAGASSPTARRSKPQIFPKPAWVAGSGQSTAAYKSRFSKRERKEKKEEKKKKRGKGKEGKSRKV